MDGTTITQPLDVAVPMPADLPIANVVTDNWPTEQVAAMPPEEWHALLRKVIKRVTVHPRSIVIKPWMPPRERTDVQPRDGSTGRFVKSTA